MVSLPKPAMAWGLTAGSGHPPCWNLSAVALWHVAVAPFLLATDQVSAHPRALCAAKSGFTPLNITTTPQRAEHGKLSDTGQGRRGDVRREAAKARLDWRCPAELG